MYQHLKYNTKRIPHWQNVYCTIFRIQNPKTLMENTFSTRHDYCITFDWKETRRSKRRREGRENGGGKQEIIKLLAKNVIIK